MNAQLPGVFADIAFNDNFVKSYMSMMAFGQFKHVKLDKHIRLQSREQQWCHICQAIRQHHAKRQGNIPYDGVIKGYHIRFNDSERLYIGIDELSDMLRDEIDIGKNEEK